MNLKKNLFYGMSLIIDWLIDLKLSLHLGKTDSILLGSSLNLNRVLASRSHVMVLI
jgi:hypothetical protein